MQNNGHAGWANWDELRRVVFGWMMGWRVASTKLNILSPQIWLIRKAVVFFVFSGGYCPWCKMKRTADAARVFHHNSKHHRVPLGYQKMFP